MPELPEVQTTVNGLKRTVVGLTIFDVWSDYDSPYFKGSGTIKDPAYFKHFRIKVSGKKVISVERRAKNILINLSGGLTILVHMKMTGHLLYGTYERISKSETRNPRQARISKFQIKRKPLWTAIEPDSLKDPFNQHVHFLISLSNKKHLALSDVRKFAKVTLVNSKTMYESEHLSGIGPEPLERSFALKNFAERLQLRPYGKIKQVLMDQKIIAGIGNIYADESLWRAGIHPLERVKNIPPRRLRELFKAIKRTLSRGIDFGGDSTSDYRNIDGDRGKFHEQHHAYQRTGDRCDKPGCGGTIVRIVVGARGTHFCDKHQRLSVK